MWFMFQSARKKKKTKRKLLNTLLSYTIVRLKEKVSLRNMAHLLTHFDKGQEEKINGTKL